MDLRDFVKRTDKERDVVDCLVGGVGTFCGCGWETEVCG